MKDALGHYARELTEEERTGLKRDSICISDYKGGKLEQDAKKNWDLFYKRNSTHFFKDRHWITREFPELLGPLSELRVDPVVTSGGVEGGNAPHKRVLLEAGCDVGSNVDPVVTSGGVEGGGAPCKRVVFLEAGCGVGNTVFPLLEENKDMFIYACDFSPKAIELLKVHNLIPEWPFSYT